MTTKRLIVQLVATFALCAGAVLLLATGGKQTTRNPAELGAPPAKLADAPKCTCCGENCTCKPECKCGDDCTCGDTCKCTGGCACKRKK